MINKIPTFTQQWDSVEGEWGDSKWFYANYKIWAMLICVSSQDEKEKEITLEKAMKLPEIERC